MIDLQRLPAAEAERMAYAEGFTGTAALFARIAELEALVDNDTEDTLREEVADLTAEVEMLEGENERLKEEIQALESRIAELEGR